MIHQWTNRLISEEKHCSLSSVRMTAINKIDAAECRTEEDTHIDKLKRLTKTRTIKKGKKSIRPSVRSRQNLPFCNLWPATQYHHHHHHHTTYVITAHVSISFLLLLLLLSIDRSIVTHAFCVCLEKEINARFCLWPSCLIDLYLTVVG